jgi:hypothetical protein
MKTPEELTEDWKAGKLDVGFYYVKGADGMFGVMSDYALYKVNLSHPDNEITLLAPVLTYDEYKAMQDQIADISKKVETLRALLKECLPIVSAEIMTWQIRGGEESHKRGQELLARINAAIGESEEQ